MSLSGLPFASFALLSRSIVPPVMNSTATPVSLVNFLAAVLATRSRQLPPQMLTISFSCACAGIAGITSSSIQRKVQTRFMVPRSSSLHVLGSAAPAPNRIDAGALRARRQAPPLRSALLRQRVHACELSGLDVVEQGGGWHCSCCQWPYPKKVSDVPNALFTWRPRRGVGIRALTAGERPFDRPKAMLLGDLGGLLACEGEAAGTAHWRSVAAGRRLPGATLCRSTPITLGMFAASSPPRACSPILQRNTLVDRSVHDPRRYMASNTQGGGGIAHAPRSDHVYG